MIAAMAGGPAFVMSAHGASTAAGHGDAGTGAKVSPGTGSSQASAGSTTTPPPAGGASPDGSAATETAPVSAAIKRDAAHGEADHDGSTSRDFAALLAASSPIESAPSPATAATSVPASTLADADVTDPATSELPGQFLALLSGSWAIPVAADTTAIAPATGNPATAMLQAATAQAGGPLLAAPPPPTAGAAAGKTGEPFAALAALAAGALGATAGPTGSDPGVSTADVPSSALDSLAVTSLAPTTATARATAPPPTAPLALPANPNAGFDDGFGARIAWMAEQRIGHAQIRLNPEHVGPIEVRVQLDGDRVSAEFHSAHAEVRQAIEASLPRLREMLGQHGLQLGQADVGHGQSGRRGDSMDSHGRDPAREAELDPRLTASPIRSTRGLLDEYA